MKYALFGVAVAPFRLRFGASRAKWSQESKNLLFQPLGSLLVGWAGGQRPLLGPGPWAQSLLALGDPCANKRQVPIGPCRVGEWWTVDSSRQMVDSGWQTVDGGAGDGGGWTVVGGWQNG